MPNVTVTSAPGTIIEVRQESPTQSVQSFGSSASVVQVNTGTRGPAGPTGVFSEAEKSLERKKRTAADVLTRGAAPESEKLALYSGATPVWSVSTTSTITNGLLRKPKRTTPGALPVDLDNDPYFRYIGVPSMEYGTTYPNTLTATPPLLIGGGAQFAYWTPRVSFWHTGQAFEFFGKTLTANFTPRVRIDGKLLTESFSEVVNGMSVGGLRYIKCDFGTSATRLIEIEFTSSMNFGGILVGPTDAISRGPEPTLRVCTLGDSIAGGANGYSRVSSWAGILSELIGKGVHMYNISIGGTGYTASEGVSDFITRVPDAVAAKPDIIFVQGGQNDLVNADAAEMETLASTLLASLRSSLPEAIIFVVGQYPQTNGVGGYAARMAHESALRAASDSVTDCYFISWIDPSGSVGEVSDWESGILYDVGDIVIHPTTTTPGPRVVKHTSGGSITEANWRATSVFYGTGRSGAATGDGNADVFISSDSIHPTAVGSKVLARSAYYQMTDALRGFAHPD